MTRVAGYCPACGGESLYLGAGDYITCSRADCARPAAAAEILDHRETNHIVHFGQTGFTIRHPLWERLDNRLLDCDLHNHIRRLAGPPTKPGRYRAAHIGGEWVWEPISEKGTNP